MRKFLLAGVMALSWHVAFAQVPTGPEQRANKNQTGGYPGAYYSGNTSWYGETVNPAIPCPLPTEVDSNVYAAVCDQPSFTNSTIARQAGHVRFCDFTAGNSTEAICEFYSATMEASSPNSWVIAAEMVIKSGVRSSGSTAEIDMVNENADCGDLTVGLSCLTLSIGVTADGIGNGRSGTFANTAAFLVQGSSTGILWHSGFVAYGTGFIDDEAFAESTDAYYGMKLAGVHHLGVDCFFGSYSEACLRLNNFQKIELDPLHGAPSIYANNGTIELAGITEVTQNLLLDGAAFAAGSGTLFLGNNTHGAAFAISDPGGAAADYINYSAATAGNFGTGSGLVNFTLAGTDGAVSLALTPKGAGELILNGPTILPTGGSFTIPSPPTGTAGSYACFTPGGQLISKGSPCV